MEYTHWIKWVLIKPVNTCFTNEFQLNKIDACSIWFSFVGGLRKDYYLENLWTIQWWKNLGINRFLIVILISFIFSTQLSQPLFIFIVIANFYCLQIDSKHWFTNFTMDSVPVPNEPVSAPVTNCLGQLTFNIYNKHNKHNKQTVTISIVWVNTHPKIYERYL